MDFVVFSAYCLIVIWVGIGIMLERTCEYLRKAIVVVKGTDDEAASLEWSKDFWESFGKDY